MSIAFIHVSDIHFGQEKGGRLVTHNDVRERLIDDVKKVLASLTSGRTAGIIVTGDIAYAGKQKEYIEAGRWLDSVANVCGCAITDIQVVPGNHDIDRDGISRGSEWMLREIAGSGETALDSFLENDLDREMFYARFQPYRKFAEGYDCPLDREGGTAGQRSLKLAPFRSLRFVGLNSALCCSTKDEEGKLLLGARQRVLPRNPGEEIVVLCHHPLHWLRDSEEARRYVRSRARIFISGHEHTPQLRIDPIGEGCDLMMLEAGAAVPPEANERYTFTYNILEFSWESESDGLKVTVHPRIWSGEGTQFEANTKLKSSSGLSFTLACPNFRSGAAVRPSIGKPESQEPPSGPPVEPVHEAVKAVTIPEQGGKTVTDKFPLLLLRFFRDLSGTQRLTVLVKLGALPTDWTEPLSHGIERQALDSLKTPEKLEALETAINEVLGERSVEND